MVSFLVIGDPHFKKSNANDVEQLIISIIAMVEENQPDYIICLGDLLDTHEILHISPFNRAYYFMQELGARAPTYLLVGNHDMLNNQQYLSDHHAFQTFKQIAGLTVVDRLTELDLEEGLFLLVPYVPNGSFVMALESEDSDEKDEKDDSGEKKWFQAQAIFCHQEFKGCKMGAIISEHGDEWDEEWPLIISGHIHDAQEPQANIIYVGSALQHAFGESGEKSIGLFIFSEGCYNYIKLPTGLKRKRIIYMGMEDVEDFDPTSKDHIKLVISGSTSDFKTFRKSKKYKELSKAGIKVAFAAVKLDRLIEKPKGPPKDYRKVVQDMIVDDDEYVKELYDEIFVHQS